MICDFNINDLNAVNKLFFENAMSFITLDEISSPFTKCVLFVEHEIIGVLLYQHIYDRIELDGLVVKEGFRKKGIGGTLLAYLIEYASCSCCSNITLEVASNNAPAIALYEKFGFVRKAIRFHYYGCIDGYLMMREM